MVDYDHLVLLFSFLFLVLITIQLNKIYAYNDPMIEKRLIQESKILSFMLQMNLLQKTKNSFTFALKMKMESIMIIICLCMFAYMN